MRKAWMNWQNAKWLLTVLAVPLALAWFSERYRETTRQQQSLDARIRLYTELLSKREEADTNIRKDMFGKVLETFLRPADSDDIDQQVTKIELLAGNFHESLNLSPLFRRLERQIEASNAPNKQSLMKDLENAARDIKERQIEALQLVGAKADATVDFASLDAGTVVSVIDDDLEFTDPVEAKSHSTTAAGQRKRHFTVEVLERDATKHRLMIRVQEAEGKHQWAFWVDRFDFPLVDFTRISGDERFTVTVRTFSEDTAALSFVYFPSSRSGIKDKPYIDEVVAGLLREHT